jgi:hypothetical protein
VKAKYVKDLLAKIESDEFDEQSWRSILEECPLGTRSRMIKRHRLALQRALLRSAMIDVESMVNSSGLDRESWIELGKNPLAPFWLEDPSSPGATLLLKAIIVDFFSMTQSLPKLRSNEMIAQRFVKMSYVFGFDFHRLAEKRFSIDPIIAEKSPWRAVFGKTIGWLNMRVKFETEQPIEQDNLVMWINGIPDQIRRTKFPDGTKALYVRNLIQDVVQVFEVRMPPTVLDFLSEEAP